ncbi:MAG: uroporphyrinogen-III synthase [Sphingomicrobium sp.]
MKRLLILRPQPGASMTLAAAAEMGLNPVSIPLFKLEPVGWKAPDPSGFDGLLLTSASAIRCAGDQLHGLRGLKAYVVGEATAAAARDAGFDIASTGSAGVRRLLESIEPRQKLIHLCGEDRADYGESGHVIDPVVVYRAADLAPSEDIRLAEDGAVMIHSPRAAGRFAGLCDQTPMDRGRISLITISSAAAEAAGTGWATVETAEKPDDMSLLALAKRLCDKSAQQ